MEGIHPSRCYYVCGDDLIVRLNSVVLPVGTGVWHGSMGLNTKFF